MLALVSPAKKMNTNTEWSVKDYSEPRFLSEIKELLKATKGLSQKDLQNLMSISENLGKLNYTRYQAFETKFTPKNSYPAMFTFRGDTYVGLGADTLSEEECLYAQDHLGILSGLYGLLRPLDLIQPYRLEMGTKLTNSKGEDLYDFWGKNITRACNKIVENHKDKTIISLASNEYIKTIDSKELIGDFLTCDFKEVKNGTPKTIGLFAKRARGAMARFIIQNKIETPEELKDFKGDGYRFVDNLSDKTTFTFLRDREK